ncbi:hypothetical protein [Nocardioides mangrovi]|uniref:Sulfotransferase family protein n=1 Tax=Nocardioides mangrovi TaxID=2874580 RepID=A0ABS7U8U1_9ACTN|nr:hypothetical protein [Nocardioides mangrovi]MBZ5737295.1 hypothetical protein [Nocardioides mangrovi]
MDVSQRVVLHVGLMKSGTSFVQRLAAGNRDLLAERGVLFLGHNWAAQVRGVSDVLDRQRVALEPEDGAWQSLVDEAAAFPGTSLISMEYLGPAGPAKIAEVVESLGGLPVEVFVTARDLGRGVPAMWQEALKNGRDITYDAYVAGVQARAEGLGRRFWREQNADAVARRWAAGPGVSGVTVVTVPRPGATVELLWQRFAEALGVDPSGVELPGPANESLGAASAEVLRLLNTRVEDLDYGQYVRRVKQPLAKKTLGARRGAEPPVGFEPPAWLHQRSRKMIEGLRGSGVRVVGDLAELEPLTVPGVAPASVPVEEQLAAAVAGLEGLARRMRPKGRK